MTASQAYAHAEAAHVKAEAAKVQTSEHEKLCAERMAAIMQTLAELKTESKDQRKLLQGLILSVAGAAILTLLAVILRGAHLA